MSTELREWFTEIWEYCQEHWVMAIAIGTVLLILLVSAILVRSAKSEDAGAEEQPEVPDTPEADACGAEPAEDHETADMELPPEDSPVKAEPVQGVVESLMKSVESASGAAGQKVESIELKIEKAQLTIRYAGGNTEAREVGFEEAVEAEKPEDEEAAAETAAAETPDQAEPEDAEEVVLPKRFGVENMNTARSGRVYTEEELLNQIRD